MSRDNPIHEALFGALIFACAAALLVATYSRNSVWGSESSLWADVVAKSPSKARPHYNYATVLAGEGRLDEALEENNKAIEIYPYYGKAHFNIGAIYHVRGRTAEIGRASCRERV